MSVIIDGDTGINKITDGSIVAADIGAGEVGATQLASTLDLSSKTVTLATNAVDQLSTASGSAPSYSARAWVSLDGVSGTPNIDASGNISSITDNGVGDYTLNFTTAMSDNLYALVMSVRRGAARIFWTSTLSTSSARVIAANLSQVQSDEAMSVAIFR